MTSAYFASFVTRPTVIEEPGRYLTRSGETVTIETVSRRHDYGCIGAYPDATPERWHKSGRIYAGVESANDIVGRPTA